MWKDCHFIGYRCAKPLPYITPCRGRGCSSVICEQHVLRRTSWQWTNWNPFTKVYSKKTQKRWDYGYVTETGDRREAVGAEEILHILPTLSHLVPNHRPKQTPTGRAQMSPTHFQSGELKASPPVILMATEKGLFSWTQFSNPVQDGAQTSSCGEKTSVVG